MDTGRSFHNLNLIQINQFFPTEINSGLWLLNQQIMYK